MKRETEQPKSLGELRRTHLLEALYAVGLFSAGAFFFWLIGFGSDTSPTMPHLLVVVSMPIVVFQEFFAYSTAKRRLGFVPIPANPRSGGLSLQNR